MKKGFTLVELLTVIAIIAILAAIIFPVAGTVRENARRSRCTSNLSQIFVALETYKQDFNAYPPVLGAYARYRDGSLILNNCNVAPANVMPFNLAPKPLGNYLKNDEIFHCPNNPVDDKQVITAAVYPAGHALAGQRCDSTLQIQPMAQCAFIDTTATASAGFPVTYMNCATRFSGLIIVSMMRRIDVMEA
jgi:prepilin-type N-terminal cleavage/methylation domain-containing protein